MPHSDLHKKKRRKNLAVLLALFIFIAMIWAVTMIKMGTS